MNDTTAPPGRRGEGSSHRITHTKTATTTTKKYNNQKAGVVEKAQAGQLSSSVYNPVYSQTGAEGPGNG